MRETPPVPGSRPCVPRDPLGAGQRSQRVEQAEHGRNTRSAAAVPPHTAKHAMTGAPARPVRWFEACLYATAVVDLTPIVIADPVASPAASRPPGLVRRAVLRFAFCYWMLFCLPIATTQILGLDWSGKLISPLWDAMVVWVGKHVIGSATGSSCCASR
jgi:hypothetical protein